MTNHWVDIKNSDLVIVMGGNAAEAHPVGFRWAIEAKKQNGAKLMVVDPRFNRSAAVADIYMPLRSGTDIAFLSGVINYLLQNDKIQHEYVKHYTNATFLINDGFKFEDGLFTGYDEATRTYKDKSTWAYQFDENGEPLRDMTMQHPRCVINVLKEHVSRYTPEMVERITGTSQKDFHIFCEEIAKTAAPDKAATFLYALGWTQHTVGSQNIRTMAMIQLLCGNIGVAGGGVNALRGHSNVQGITDLGLFPNRLPAYLPLPTESDTSLESFLNRITPKKMGKDQTNYWGNTPKFFISMMKSFFGDKATAENEFGFHYLPKLEKGGMDHMRFIEKMYEGKVNGYFCQGMNPVASYPNSGKIIKALSNLKYLVIFDPLITDTSEFWMNHGEFNDVDPAQIQTEVFRLPTTCFAEEDGSIANSGRWLQWHWKAADAPFEAKPDVEILSELRAELLALYAKEGGKAPLAGLEAMSWNYANPRDPKAEELAKENNGYALVDLKDANGNLVVKKGELLPSFAFMRDDGTTSGACWIYTGQWTQKGNQMANRDNSDPSGLGNTLGWAFAWPVNRRILYNRASADLAGNPWNPKRQLVKWNGTNWNYIDVADFGTAPPNSPTMPFIMQPEGVSGLFVRERMVDGPFPEHYEPMETPIGTNPLHPNVVQSPVARILPSDKADLGTSDEFPYVGTTYRLTEHFHYWTKNSLINVVAQPEQFVEISEALAVGKGISNGDRVRVWSKRGEIKCVALVTKRIRPLVSDGKPIHTVGIPIHWGFAATTKAKKGYFANNLTVRSGDANTQTPESKCMLVNIEKIGG
ncbi:Formate dehydrogenase, alpha subunit [Bibersteinia trehalosi USDA-ARS-USMARC-188]|uniref:Formate dehydrogenase, alpha subunit n=2 Tax=Bibersteinia trehalosi TaxID=47735 RepID=A0A4V7IA19_BIBTR|nr:Formate dehydrogenase, alpha subunit [Bibersteinia trehalosi USDA-ARS-USMARC-192]AHG81873.1 Formate dehydrogenase, alpha subunit [Bibersteinia trehalosi USDA-ARS-USMARC-188]